MQATEGNECTVTACPLDLVPKKKKKWHYLALWFSGGEQKEAF